MEKLTKEDLWGRVRRLEGTTVLTIQHQNENPIWQVSPDKVYIRYTDGVSQKTRPTKEQIWATYKYLWTHCQVTHHDFENALHGILNKRVARIVPAILTTAVPEQIEAFKRGPGVPRSGIRLKKW